MVEEYNPHDYNGHANTGGNNVQQCHDCDNSAKTGGTGNSSDNNSDTNNKLKINLNK